MVVGGDMIRSKVDVVMYVQVIMIVEDTVVGVSEGYYRGFTGAKVEG